MGYFMLLAAVVQWLAFETASYSPMWLSLLLMLLAAGHVLRQFLRGATGLLGAYGFLVLMLPFVHLVGYLWFDFGREFPPAMWGLAANPYMWDEQTAMLLGMLGATAACAYGAALSWLGRFQPQAGPPPLRAAPMPYAPMMLSTYTVLGSAAIVFAYLSAPQETVLTAAYLASTTVSESINFSSSGFLGYIILLFLAADAMLDGPGPRRVLKLLILAAATLVVTVWLQLMRGDRESLTFVVAAFAIFYYWADLVRHTRPGVRFARIHKPRLIAAGVALYFVYYTVGTMRSVLAGSVNIGDVAYAFDRMLELRALAIDNLLVGTWTGALMSPLSVAGDYVRGLMPYRLGETYLDIVLSIPPGFVADWLGYVRPIDATRGPAHEMIYGIGGTHAVVVPFMNFGMAGVVGILMLWGALLNLLDRAVARRPSYYRICLCAVLFGVLPHWFWYGEKNAINVLILWAGLSAVVWLSNEVARAFRTG